MSQNSDKNEYEQVLIEGLRAIYKQLATQNQLLERIAIAAEQTAQTVQQMAEANAEAPNYKRPLESFRSFDWNSIGAVVDAKDQQGPTVVSWKGLQFTRRSPSNKFGEIIFYSRCIGKDEDGNNKYERLISFKPISRTEIEPLPEKVMKYFN